jgi:hypothetical protein
VDFLTAGDVVTGFSANNAVLNFQPALPNTVMITGFTDDGVAGSPYIINAATANGTHWTYPTDYGFNTQARIFIDNANYLRLQAKGAGQYSSYCGIQIQ